MNPRDWEITAVGVAGGDEDTDGVWRVRATHLPSGLTASSRGRDLMFEIAFCCQKAMRIAAQVRAR